MRARLPDDEGLVEIDDVRIGWERHGDAGTALLLLPGWSVAGARLWKGQVAHLARRHRVITIDPPGNGRSSRPIDPAPYHTSAIVDVALRVLDVTSTQTAVVVSVSDGSRASVALARHAADRVRGQILIGPNAMVGDPPPLPPPDDDRFHPITSVWKLDWHDYIRQFTGRVLPEPHSSKGAEDLVRWARDTTPDVIRAEIAAMAHDPDPATTRAWCAEITTPSLVVLGTEDGIVPADRQREFATALGADVVEVEGGGHSPQGRWPVLVNRLIDRFVTRLGPEDGEPSPTRAAADLAPVADHDTTRSYTPRPARRPRVLYLSSPIGLGHVNRDVAIARELRGLRDDVQVDWLSQDPVTGVLQQAGERVHPASRWLANESAHITQEAHDHGGHGLHAFQSLRRMDEILVANFMVFQEVVEEGGYDLVVGDEAWDVDRFWHEHPELKRGAHVWLTDFVGFVPMASGGDHEALLTADYNAEMVELVAASPMLRDRSIFVGNPDDVIDDPLGPELPSTRGWTEDHFDFSGYITGFTPPATDEAAALRLELGYRPDERVCIVAVGGSGVGEPVLRRAIDAFPLARQRVSDLRMVVVAGPRIDPSTLPDHDGIEVRGYVPALHRHLSVCDLAIVQGGLTTTMELTASKRPFISFPLADHFEQQVHVRHRLDRYRAGDTMDFATTDADGLADAMVTQLDAHPDYRDVETDGATRAAKLISDLI